MNVYFKILWFEDTVEWFRTSERKVKLFIREHELEPIIERKIGNDFDLNSITSNEYDLILMDYNLAEGKSGENIIQSIRNHNVLTDILFYSAQYDEMLKAITGKIPPIDGIYYVERKNELFFEKANALVSKIIRRSQDVVNLRGVVLDNGSEFESKINEILILAWQKIKEDEKDRIRKYVKNDVLIESKGEYNNTIDQMIDAKCCFVASVNSRDYIVDSRRKAGILGRIINILRQNYKLDLDTKYNSFANNYYIDIIQYRNALGHSKKNRNDQQNVYIGKDKDGNEIIFNEQLYRQLRSSMNEYSKLFDNIVDYITSNM